MNVIIFLLKIMFSVFFVILSLAGYQGAFAQVIANYNLSQCLSGEDLKLHLGTQVLDTVKHIPNCPCGGAGKWRRIVDIDMSNSSQVCLSNWTLVSTSDFRGCGRSTHRTGSCDSVFFSYGSVFYTRICGRINGIQYGSTKAFYVSTISFWRYFQNLESAYLAGVSLTRGSPGSRKHVWTVVSALNNNNGIENCLCSSSATWPYEVNSFINDNYFCETGNHGTSHPARRYNTL